jgi:hypothetical protein
MFAEWIWMRHFGTMVFGLLTAVSAIAVLWWTHGAGDQDAYASVFGMVMSPMLYLVFVGPFAILFVVSLARGSRH